MATSADHRRTVAGPNRRWRFDQDGGVAAVPLNLPVIISAEVEIAQTEPFSTLSRASA